MKILETALIGKKPGQSFCEDGLYLSADFAAVIDGVTSKGNQIWGGLTSGAHAKNVLIEALKGMPRSIAAGQLMEALDCSLADAYHRGATADNRLEWLRASIIIYSDYHHEIWSVGDCCCHVGGRFHYHRKKLDMLNATVRSVAIQAAMKQGATEQALLQNDIGRETILPLLALQQEFENCHGEFGYCVLNGHGLPPDGIVRYPVAEGEHVVLASDGYPKLFLSLAESEAYLADAIAKDPLCYQQHRSTKGVAAQNCSFDDRCYCSLIADL